MSIATQSPGSRPPTSSSPTTSNPAKKSLPPPASAFLRLLQSWLCRLSTPTLLQLLLGATWLCVLLFWIAVYTGMGVYRNGVQRVGRDVAPSFVQAPHIKAILADMDASVIRLLLIPHRDERSLEAQAVLTSYDDQQKQLAIALTQATETIISGDQERTPLINLQNEVGRYDALVARTLTLHELASDAKAEAKVREAYNATSEKIYSVMIPLADNLQAAKQGSLEAAYVSQYQARGSAISGAFFSGLLLLIMLGVTQYALFRRTRRFINPGLGVATLLTLSLLFWTALSFNNVATQLYFATGSGFTRLKNLAETSALAHTAQAAESRALLAADGDARKLNTDTFDNKIFNLSALLNDRPPDSSSTVSPSLDDAIAHLVNYKEAHQTLVAQLESGRRAQALQTYADTASGSPRAAFNDFDVTLWNALKDSQDTFDTSIDATFDLLGNHELICSLLALAIAFSAFLGIAPRLKEYAL